MNYSITYHFLLIFFFNVFDVKVIELFTYFFLITTVLNYSLTLLVVVVVGWSITTNNNNKLTFHIINGELPRKRRYSK